MTLQFSELSIEMMYKLATGGQRFESESHKITIRRAFETNNFNTDLTKAARVHAEHMFNNTQAHLGNVKPRTNTAFEAYMKNTDAAHLKPHLKGSKPFEGTGSHKNLIFQDSNTNRSYSNQHVSKKAYKSTVARNRKAAYQAQFNNERPEGFKYDSEGCGASKAKMKAECKEHGKAKSAEASKVKNKRSNEAVKTVTNNCIFTSDSVINQAIDRFGAIVQQTVKDDLIGIFITSLIASTLTKIPDLIRGRESKMSILKHIIKETLTSTAQGMCLTVLTKAVLEVIGNTFPGLHTPIIIYSHISRIIMFYNLAKAAIQLAFEIFQAIQDRRIEDLNKDEPEMTETEVEEFISTCAPLEYRTMQERIDELKAEKEAEKELARLNHENDPKTIAIKEAYAIRLQELGITQEGFNDKPVSKQIIIKHKSVSVDEQAIKANKTLSDSMNQRNIDAELINKSAKTVAEKAKEEFYSKLKINTKPVIINQSKAKQNAPRTFIGCQNGFAMYA